MSKLKRLQSALRLYFLSNFHSHEFGYILYPFARILKLFGFAPVKLNRGEVLRVEHAQLQWDFAAWLWTIANLVLYNVGFAFGVYHLRMNQKQSTSTDASGISHFTSWAQIVTLFILGIIAWFTAWTHIDELCRLCALIFKIDRHLREIADIEFDYKHLRRRLLVELFVKLIVSFPLSMVNCIIIQPAVRVTSLVATCFWFICFAPISLLIFKEFVFYNLMSLLMSKLRLINGKLASFGQGAVPQQQNVRFVRKMNSVSEMPLTAVSPGTSHSESLTEQPNLVTLQKLLLVYTYVADGIEMVLRIFSWHLLFLTAVSFGVITIQSYNLFALVMHSLEMQTHQIIYIIAWIMVQIMAIGVNVSVCSKTSYTMSTTASLLHKIKPPSNEEPDACIFYQILLVFSREVMHRKSNFTAAGFFTMDYKLITSILASVTTYLVIIIQFHLTNIPDCHYPHH